jgi:tRNA threonylcarbamoyladenosine biosynthesis protein TsaB
MIVLAFDCSSAMSIALLKDNKIIDQKFIDQNYSHSEKLILEIKNLLLTSNLDLSNIDLFVANNGPGSYTGIRVALASLKMFKISYQKPCFVLNSFEILLEKYRHVNMNLNIAITGNPNEIFFAKYQFIKGEILSTINPIITDFDNIKKQLKSDDFICGSANKLFIDHQFKSNENDNFLVYNMAILATKNYENKLINLQNEILPLYLREPNITFRK